MLQTALGVNRWLRLGLLAALLVCVSGGPKAREDYTVTHLDIRDAILSLLPVLRDQINKLERHEYRERQLGDQMTRAINVLDKKIRTQDKTLDGLVVQLTRSEEHLQKMEEAMNKREEEHKAQLERMSQVMDDMRTQIVSGGGAAQQGKDAMVQLVDELRNKGHQMDEAFQRQLQHMENEVKMVNERTEQQMFRLEEMLQNMSTQKESEKIRLAIEDIRLTDSSWRQQLKRLEEEMQRHRNQSRAAATTTTTTPAPTVASAVLSSEALDAVLDALDGQQRKLEEVGTVVEKTSEDVQELLRSMSASRMEAASSALETRDGLEGLRVQVEASADNTTGSVEAQVVQLRKELMLEQEEVGRRFEDTHALGEALLETMHKSHKEIMHEMQGMSNVESVLLDTADGVLDTKRRIEYGVQQILMEVGEAVKKQAEDLNQSVQKRFEDLSALILRNQTVALRNLTSQMEKEISQVWRQIGIMYHQLSLSADMLDKIHSQTESYVNNSIRTMDSMDGKVGMITNRMGEVDGNLNYLVGRLSLVTQEFNSIKSGLGQALQDFREGLKEQVEELERKEFTTGVPQEDTTSKDISEEDDDDFLPGSIN